MVIILVVVSVMYNDVRRTRPRVWTVVRAQVAVVH